MVENGSFKNNEITAHVEIKVENLIFSSLKINGFRREIACVELE